MLNKRMIVGSITILFGNALALSTRAAPPADSTSISAGSAGLLPARPAEPAIALLAKRVDGVNWIEKPLEEVFEWFKEEAEGAVDVIPRWTALNTESVDEDSLVTLSLRGATLGEVLQEVLDLLSEDGALGFHAYHDKLRISTKTDFDRKLYLRVYDVNDILFRVPDMGQDAPQIDLQTVATSGSGGGGGGQSVFSGAGGGSQQTGGEQAEQEFNTQLQALATLIQDVVAPETWATGATGGRGRIRVFNRSLVVSNTIEVHETIAGSFTYED